MMGADRDGRPSTRGPATDRSRGTRRVLTHLCARCLAEDDAQDFVEYAFLVGLIALLVAIGLTNVGLSIDTFFAETVSFAPPFAS